MALSGGRGRCLVIAEAGVNHNGSVDVALRLVDTAAECDADIIKFQTFRAERLAAASAPKTGYQVKATGGGSQIEMLRALELSDADFRRVAAACAGCGIEFLSTPFDEESATFLVKELGVRRLKSPSGEITNAPLLLHMARLGLPVILSTGMSVLGEIEMALAVLAYGYCVPDDHRNPDPQAFGEALASRQGQDALASRVTILHCTSEYPAPLESVNLRAMDTLAAAFGLPVGFSDHTEGISIPVAAAARGAEIIEKHFTLDRAMPGPDHKSSLAPSELAAMVSGIRDVEQAMGHGRKLPVEAEKVTADAVRKSLVAARLIARGESFSRDNLTTKRPGTGVSPLYFWSYLGRRAPRDYRPDELIDA